MREPSHVKHHTWVRLTCLCALAVSSTLWATHAWAFKIVAPANGTTLTSGQPTAAEVEAGRVAGLVEVRYYWYPEQTEALVEQGEERAGKASNVAYEPPVRIHSEFQNL